MILNVFAQIVGIKILLIQMNLMKNIGIAHSAKLVEGIFF